MNVNGSILFLSFEVLEKCRQFNEGWIVACLAKPDSKVLAPDFHRDLRLVVGPGEQNTAVVDLSGEVLTDDLLGRLHRGYEECDAVYPVDARLNLVRPTERQPDYILEEGTRIHLLDDLVDDKLLVRRVGDLQVPSLGSVAGPSGLIRTFLPCAGPQRERPIID